MCKSSKFLTVALSAAFLITLASSVSADPVRQPPGQQKLNPLLLQTVESLDFSSVDISALLSDHFAGNNGKHRGFINQLVMHEGEDLEIVKRDNNGRHLGFSVAQAHGGLTPGMTKPRPTNVSVTENPEPTAVLLMGTGLAAGAAYVRRRTRKRRQE